MLAQGEEQRREGRKCWRKMTSVPSCSCDLAAFTHGLSVCATVFISCDKLDECHVPEDKTACSFVCGLPHMC